MRCKFNLLLLVFIFLFLLGFNSPSFSGASQSGAVFLIIFPGARPTGMAAAFSAIADDALATYYNDAGLAFQDKSDAALQHANWLSGLYPGMYYEFAGFVHPIETGVIGGHIIYLTTGETQAVDPYGREIAKFTSFDLSVKASYGTKLRENLGVGVGVKFIYCYLVPSWIIWEVLQEKGGGYGISWAFDFSTMYKTKIRGLTLGLSLQNLGPNISYLDTGESDPLPWTLRFGTTYKIFDTKLHRLTTSVELTKILVGLDQDFKDMRENFEKGIEFIYKDTWKAIGVEYLYYNFIALRVGHFWDTAGSREGLTFGGGIHIRGLRFDIGVDSELYEFDTSNYRFSLNYLFGG